MKKFSALLIAFAIALPAASAHARGDGGNQAQEKREKLQAEIRAQRASGGDNCVNASLWEMMFGHDEAVAEAETPASTSQ